MMIFDIGLSAIRANQQALQTISNNIANANTEGYHRQRVSLVDRAPLSSGGLQFGTGVEVAQIERLRNAAVEQSLTFNISQFSEAGTKLSTLEMIERVLTPSSGSLHSQITQFFNSVEELAANPSESVLRRDVLTAAQGIAREVNALHADLDLIERQLADEIRHTIDEINELAARIARLENEIRAARAQGGEPNTLLDQRDRAVNQLAELIDISPQSLADDGSPLIAAGGWLVIGSTTQTLQARQTDDGRVEIHTTAGLGPVTPSSGKLAALLTAHNDWIDETRDVLNEWTTAFLSGVDSIQATGLGLGGPVESATGHRRVADVTVPLSEAGTLLPVNDGELFVTVTDRATGARNTYGITIDPSQDSLQDVIGRLNQLPNVQASIAPGANTVTIAAASGFLIDFAGRLDTFVDTSGMSGTAVPTMQGTYTGSTNREWTVTALGSGQVGVTDGLLLRVTDAVTGEVIKDLNVGAGYPANQPIAIADGISLSLTSGALAAGDVFSVNVVGNGDTSGILAALGIQSLFHAENLTTLSVNADLLRSPEMLGISRTGETADASQSSRFVNLRNARIFASGTETLEERLATLTSSSGLAVRAQRVEVEQLQLRNEQLLTLRDSVSGVDPNEEFLSIMEFQRAFQAAARFVTSVNETMDELLRLIR